MKNETFGQMMARAKEYADSLEGQISAITYYAMCQHGTPIDASEDKGPDWDQCNECWKEYFLRDDSE